MAKYNVEYKCGHEAEVQLYGPTKARYSRIDWMEKTLLCPDCYRAEKEKERKASLDNAKKNAKKLPELTGSEKQINWALTIRENALKSLDKTIKNIAEEHLTETYAGWWINNRQQLA